MALIAQQSQVSYPKYCFKSGLTSFAFIPRKNELISFVSLKYQLHSRSQPLYLQTRRPIRIPSFKRSAQNDKHGHDESSPKPPKSRVRFSEPMNMQKYPISYEPEERGENPKVVSSNAIKRLFRKFLHNLRTQPLCERTVNESTRDREEPSASTIEEIQSADYEAPHVSESKSKSPVLKTAFLFFTSFDAALSIPLLVFVPGYFTVRMTYGAEVAAELMPLWFLGPPLLALYVKVIQKLLHLYFLIFTRAGLLLKDLPFYSRVAYAYVKEGKVKAYFYETLWGSVVRLKELDYQALAMQKYMHIRVWLVEVYLDLTETIWPYYCRTIKMLKKANLL
ncbi:embryo defective 2759 [Rhynchospora pubera]|uniref:Embryo defective 2759 n=1 Tax=Rhynchospora pubera TaxID=906938 RepID=A0AAV8FQW7_9POAL|nr:embryo defective 2759 [Rhynchospora pubera]KAJ4764441.1 embryo defective 2759 [Rhynchospora pubera]KAJ4793332.1 embryo defective 2759 [Rhynchospora pubera]